MAKENNRAHAERAKDGKQCEVVTTRNGSPLMIGDAMCGAFEGGSNYWLHTANLVRSDFPKEKGLVWYGADHMFDGEFEFEVGFDDPDGEEGEGKGRMVITRADVLKGLELMARHDPEEFNNLADVESSKADASTYDVFMQFVVLGAVVYG